MVPSKRLELLRLSALPPQDSVSTNSTTTATIIRDNPATASDLRQRRLLWCYFGISEDLPPSAGTAGDGAEGAGAAGFCAGGAAPCGTAGISSCCVTPPDLDGIEK